MKPIIKVRVDSNELIGLGHLFRTISIAQILKNDFDFHFFTKSQTTIDKLTNYSFDFTLISSDKEFLIKLCNNDIVLLDGYEFKTDFERKIKLIGCFLICIDDLNDHQFYADIIINHGSHFTSNDFYIQSYTKLYLGPKYILVRPDFLSQCNSQFIDRQNLNSVFLSFGGASNIEIIKSAISVFEFLNFNVINIVFGNNSDAKSVLSLNSPNLKCFSNLNSNQIVELIQKSDLAFVPASTIILESFCVGIPIISGWVYQNQNHSLSEYESNGLIINLGDLSINLEEKLLSVFESVSIEKFNSLAHNQKKMIFDSRDNIKEIFNNAANR